MAGNTTASAAENNIAFGTYMKQWYNYLFYEDEDPRALELPLTNNMHALAAAMSGYFFLVCFVIPRLMMGRSAMKLTNALTVYNAFQVIVNSWIITLCIKGGWFTSYSFICQPVDYSRSPAAMTMVHASWLFYISKMIDCCDTVFFALRKKYDQITFLHVIHHAAMPGITWYQLKFVAGGHTSFLCLLNSFVHVLMYSYYFLAGLGYHKYLWWKKYLTTFQMFIILGVHQGQLLFIECDYLWFPKFWTVVLETCMFFLFLNFYLQSYGDTRTKRQPNLSSYSDKYACFQVEGIKQRDNNYDIRTDDSNNN